MMTKFLIAQSFAGMASVGTVLMASMAILAAPANAPDYTPNPVFDGIMCDSDTECEEATGYPYDVAINGGPKYPRLVGIGCVGANGPIYAFEEDHLPECREVFAMDWEWRERIR